ncbi:hypothetical protein BOTBODRAFT_43993 [Botryobasidium botryosum FD-172 SS1]|uniref:Uncharacterized protein n=1 Tax=Botryobasidium botryosum (strain FD-172 SS1) TaxID=930990 RepID=A0A067MIW6_BOTB1|nr:hypothetical protein BOTBODRAFT_43993 [Botryobasidium botryosum FD-172 SS1]
MIGRRQGFGDALYVIWIVVYHGFIPVLSVAIAELDSRLAEKQRSISHAPFTLVIARKWDSRSLAEAAKGEQDEGSSMSVCMSIERGVKARYGKEVGGGGLRAWAWAMTLSEKQGEADEEREGDQAQHNDQEDQYSAAWAAPGGTQCGV